MINDIKQHLNNKKNNNEPIIIELGPGENKYNDNSIGLDICKKKSVDYVVDLSNGLKFLDDNSIDSIYAFHFLEHIDNIEFFMSEINRVLKLNGFLIGTVPHFSNPYFYSDYTHRNFWGLYTLSYFSKNKFFARGVPCYYNNVNLEIIEIKLNFKSPFGIRNIIKKCFQYMFNINSFIQEFYEEFLVYIIPCYEIEFKVKKV